MTSDKGNITSIKFINPNDNTSNDIIKYNDPVSISTTDGTRIAYYYDDGNAHTDRPLIFDTVDNIANISSKSLFYIKSELNSYKTAPIYAVGDNVNYTDYIGIATSAEYYHTSNGWYGARNMIVSGSSHTNIEMDFIHGDDTYDGHSNTGFPETFNMSLTSIPDIVQIEITTDETYTISSNIGISNIQSYTYKISMNPSDIEYDTSNDVIEITNGEVRYTFYSLPYSSLGGYDKRLNLYIELVITINDTDVVENKNYNVTFTNWQSDSGV